MMKIIDKIFFCMKRNSRIGLFLSVGVTTEVAALMSLLSTISLLIWTGFSTQAILLLLLSVRIGFTEKYLFILLNQYIGVAIFFLQMRGDKIFGAKTGPKKWAMNLGLLTVAPMVPLLLLLGFSYSWKTNNIKREV